MVKIYISSSTSTPFLSSSRFYFDLIYPINFFLFFFFLFLISLPTAFLSIAKRLWIFLLTKALYLRKCLSLLQTGILQQRCQKSASNDNQLLVACKDKYTIT